VDEVVAQPLEQIGEGIAKATDRRGELHATLIGLRELRGTQSLYRWRLGTEEADMAQVVLAWRRVAWRVRQKDAGRNVLEALRVHHLGEIGVHVARLGVQIATLMAQCRRPAVGRIVRARMADN